MSTENTLATRLKAVMDEKGVGIPELSKALGITYEMVRRYVMGVAKPREKKLKLKVKY